MTMNNPDPPLSSKHHTSYSTPYSTKYAGAVQYLDQIPIHTAFTLCTNTNSPTATAPSRGQVMEWNNKHLTPMSSFESDDDDDDEDDDDDDEEDEVDQDHQEPST